MEKDYQELFECAFGGVMAISDWVISIGFDWKAILLAAFGAVVGAVIKWLLDRPQNRQLVARLDASIKKISGQQSLISQKESELSAKAKEIERLERSLSGRGERLTHRETELRNLLDTLRDSETSLWAKFPRKPFFQDHDVRIGKNHPVILTIANLKGGVGKTTLTGNLIAHFDKLQKRVLAIDLDYQGSLTTMMRGFGDPQARTSSVIRFFEPGAATNCVWQATRSLGPELHRSRLASAFYEFARYEEFLMTEWLLQMGGDDVRYRLSRLLLHDDIRNEFDVVLIDVPPRLTTGTINALCASTHLIIPAIFNPLSAEPVGNFVKMSKSLADHLNPKLEFLGVLEMMSPRANEGQDLRAAGKRMINEALQRLDPAMGILGAHIPRRTAIAHVELASLNGNREIKEIFAQVGSEIQQRVGL